MPRKSKSPQVALVTGGAVRIGQAISLALARNGYSVALHYGHSRAQARATANQIQKQGGVCKTFSCDLASAQAAEKLVPDVLKEFGRLDVLINSASIFEKSTLKDGSLELWDRHFAVNLKAPYILLRAFARNVKEGSIINILDTHIVQNKTAHAAYLLSKKSLAELTKIAAIEFAPAIRVNGVAPGLILPPASYDEAYLDRLAKQVPLQRKGNPEHIVQAILFLLASDYVTGQVIYEDGGEHLV